MAVTFTEERKKQRKLLTILGFLIVVLIIVLGQGFLKRLLTERLGIKSVIIESDMTDFRVYSEDQARKNLEAFFEGLES